MNSQATLQQWRTPLLMAGVGLSAFCSGALASLSLVTIPTILTSTSTTALLTGWRHTLQYGGKLCPPFAIMGAVAHGLSAYFNRDLMPESAKLSVVAAVSTIGAVPFTFAFLQGTNAELYRRDEAAKVKDEEAWKEGGGGKEGEVEMQEGTVELVRRWGRLNMWRALFPAVGAVVGCFTL